MTVKLSQFNKPYSDQSRQSLENLSVPKQKNDLRCDFIIDLIRNFCYFRTWTDSLFKTRKNQEEVTSRTSGILKLERRDIGEKYVGEYYV